MINLLDAAIRIICYVGATLGLWLIVSPLIVPRIKKNMTFTKFRKGTGKSGEINKNKIIRHIEMMISVTFNKKSNFALFTFIVITLSLFLIMFTILLRSNINMLMRITVTVITAAMPYIFLRIRLYTMRIEASYEAEGLVNELYNQYRINYSNMVEAIDNTIPELRRYHHSKRALVRLSMGLKQYRNVDELDDIIQEFTFAINTQWAMFLANNIFISIEYGDDVSESLNDILSDVKGIKKNIEDDKQANHESFFMIKYVAPISYGLSVFGALKYFGFTIERFMQYQLNTDMGLRFFILTMGSMIVNFIIYLAARKPKYDY